MKDTTIGIIFAIAIIVFVVSIFGYSAYLFGLEHAEFKEELSNIGIEIQEGSVKSPAIIITLENKTAFLAKVIELEATTVYYTGIGTRWISARYYVFTKDYNIAYKLDLGGD